MAHVKIFSRKKFQEKKKKERKKERKFKRKKVCYQIKDDITSNRMFVTGERK